MLRTPPAAIKAHVYGYVDDRALHEDGSFVAESACRALARFVLKQLVAAGLMGAVWCL